MAIDREQLLHVAHLARLELREDEVERLGAQLNDILAAVSKVSELDLSDVPPTSHPLDVVNVWGEDEPRPCLPVEEALANAPEREGDFFKVPPGGAVVIDTLRLTRRGGAAARSTRRRGLAAPSSSRPTAPRSTSATRSCTATCTSATTPGGDGIPIAVKDVIGTKGIPTTAGSKILEGYVPVYDATVDRAAARRTACASSARRTPTSSRWARRPRTPRTGRRTTRGIPSRVPGGSGGGSAAAVAAGLAPWALGSDTGGSIKQPAALCGNVGLRPTYGTVSRYGVVAFASSLDQVGPVARNVRDCALLYSIIAGRDPCDSTTVELPHAGRAAGGATT